MAKKKMGRPNAGRDDVTVKIDRAIAFRLKQVAGHRGTTVAKLLSEIADAPVAKAYRQMLDELGPQ